MLLQHNISAAAHHGGKLNGIDCCELIQLTKQIFGKIETYVLSSSNPDRCSDNTIINTCSLYQDCFVTVDKLSKLRRKHGEPDEEDYKVGFTHAWKIRSKRNPELCAATRSVK